MSSGDLIAILGMLVGLAACVIGYYALADDRQAQLRDATFLWAERLFTVVLGIGSIGYVVAFSLGEGPPTRKEIVTFAIYFLNVVLLALLAVLGFLIPAKRRREAQTKEGPPA